MNKISDSMGKKVFLSICIPSYNRPAELERLLRSIDCTRYADEIEIVITEDKSPKREEVRTTVEGFRETSPYSVVYHENTENLGYDHNIRHVAELAGGTWVMFMGDDDLFLPGALDPYIDFLKGHPETSYVLRRYEALYADGTTEEFRYDKKDVFLPAGEDSYVEFFRRSVFISGFCFRKECFTDYSCADYDGTLLFQLYIEAQICLNYSSAYCDIPITQSIEGGTPYFGHSAAEKDKYTSGSNPASNSLNFMKQVRVLADSIDAKNGIHCAQRIMDSYSKYSYGFLLSQRDAGVKIYRDYAKELKKLGFAGSGYFYLYYWMLLIFGTKGSRGIIRFIKRALGKTPRL